MTKMGLLFLASFVFLTGCASNGQSMDGPDTARSYQQIDQETAK
jgi:uncharacterized lipoprotein YajG